MQWDELNEFDRKKEDLENEQHEWRIQLYDKTTDIQTTQNT